jgi:3-oxoadipate enol-lactonase
LRWPRSSPPTAHAQTAALTHPERLESLALLATTDYPFEAFEGRARSAERDGMAAQIVPSLTRWFTPEALAVNGWGVRCARKRVLRGQVDELHRYLAAA